MRRLPAGYCGSEERFYAAVTDLGSSVHSRTASGKTSIDSNVRTSSTFQVTYPGCAPADKSYCIPMDRRAWNLQLECHIGMRPLSVRCENVAVVYLGHSPEGSSRLTDWQTSTVDMWQTPYLGLCEPGEHRCMSAFTQSNRGCVYTVKVDSPGR